MTYEFKPSPSMPQTPEQQRADQLTSILNAHPDLSGAELESIMADFEEPTDY